MTRSARIIVAAFFFSALVSTTAFGAMIHVTSDLAGTSSVLNLPLNTATDIYVVADNFSPGDVLLAYEFSISFPSSPGFSILGEVFPPGSLNVASGPYNYIVGLQAPVATSPRVTLATFSLISLLPIFDELVTLGPSSPSDFNPAEPGFLINIASDDNIYPFTFASDLLINPRDMSAPPLYPPVPEPSTFLLLGGGLAGLAFYARRRRKE